MLEAEVKLRLEDEAALRHRLAGLGARCLGAAVEEDTFFAHPGRDLAAGDEALRLRRSGGAMTLTYKGPRQPGAAKVRQEWNVGVADDPTPLLRALGFGPTARLRKRRERFTVEGAGVEVAIDHLEGLGAFVEVEATGTERDEALRRVQDAVAALGLQDAPVEPRTYAELAGSRL